MVGIITDNRRDGRGLNASIAPAADAVTFYYLLRASGLVGGRWNWDAPASQVERRTLIQRMFSTERGTPIPQHRELGGGDLESSSALFESLGSSLHRVEAGVGAARVRVSKPACCGFGNPRPGAGAMIGTHTISRVFSTELEIPIPQHRDRGGDLESSSAFSKLRVRHFIELMRAWGRFGCA